MRVTMSGIAWLWQCLASFPYLTIKKEDKQAIHLFYVMNSSSQLMCVIALI